MEEAMGMLSVRACVCAGRGQERFHALLAELAAVIQLTR
jgi:hypothetical protein